MTIPRMAAHRTRPSIAASVVFSVFFGLVLVDFSAAAAAGSNSGKIQQLQQRKHLKAQHAALLSAASSGSPSSDEPTIIYENGIVVETVLDENHLGISIFSTLAVPSKEFLYAVDSTASQLLKVRLPIDQSSGASARRVAGDRKGQTGYNDGWGEDALLDHPKGLAVDGDGNVYVADVRNRVIRKINAAGFVTTVAGQPNKTGHADGEGTKALFSSDFTLTYLPRTCSLLISDRGNGRLRMIQLKNPPLICDPEGLSSDHVWKTVSYIFGVLVTILSAALGTVLFQKAELQRIYNDDEDELNRLHNGGASDSPYLTMRPRLTDSTAALRRVRSLPDDVSAHNGFNLIDFSGSTSDGEENNPPANRIGNSAFRSSEYAESEALLGMSFPSDEGDGTLITDGATVRSSEQNLLPDPESMLTGLNDTFSRHLNSNSEIVAPERRSSIEAEIIRNIVQFTRNGGT